MAEPSDLTTELEVVRSIYGDAVAIAANNVITMTAGDASLVMHVPDSYPTHVPAISVKVATKGSSISPAAARKWSKQLATEAEANAGSPCLFQIIDAFNNLMTDFQDASAIPSSSSLPAADADALQQPTATGNKPLSSSATTPPPSKRSTPPRDDGPSKKPPMRTSTDVVDRVRWDDDLPQDLIVVGYLDRFIGIIEKPFNAFNWSDLSTLSHMECAIPRHRIVYFKYMYYIQLLFSLTLCVQVS